MRMHIARAIGLPRWKYISRGAHRYVRKVCPAIAIVRTLIRTVVDKLKINFILSKAKFEGSASTSRIIQIVQNKFFFSATQLQIDVTNECNLFYFSFNSVQTLFW